MKGMEPPACIVITLDPRLAKELHKNLESEGFTFSKPQYTHFSARKEKEVICTLFTTGKLTIQGSKRAEFLRSLPPKFHTERHEITSKERPVLPPAHIGVDESGKGDFFGPLCIAAVFADESLVKKFRDWGVDDSKKLTDPQICILAEKIKTEAKHFIIRLMPEQYNALYAEFGNLNTLLAAQHAKVIKEVQRQTGATDALIDQFASESVVSRAIAKENITINLVQRTKAESDAAVAAASILARATFTLAIDELSDIADMKIPKGAAPIVKTVAAALARKFGTPALASYCKLHFKTYSEVTHGQHG